MKELPIKFNYKELMSKSSENLVTCTIISHLGTYLTADASGAVSHEEEKSKGSIWRIEYKGNDCYRIINAAHETYLRSNFLNIIDTSVKADNNTTWTIRKKDNDYCLIRSHDNRYLRASPNKKLGTTKDVSESEYFLL